MRNTLFYLPMMALCVLSCSNYNNSTPEDFGRSLVEILKVKDTLAFNNLQMTTEDLIQVIEDDQDATEAEKKIAIGILEQGGIGPMKTINLDKDWNKRLDNFYDWAEKYYGISEWKKVTIANVESKKLEGPGDKFKITISLDYMGKSYTLNCHEVYNVPKKGYMFLNKMPVLRISN